MSENLRIVSLTAENIKKLKVVAINPIGDVVEITGPNGSGKTSILDSIYWVLKGKEVIQSEPIRVGEDHAMIRLDLGKYIVERTFKRDTENKDGYTTKLVVTSKDKATFSSPQALVDSWLGSLSFNPLEFLKSDKKTQASYLKTLIPNFDFKASEQAEQVAFSERTVVNRQLKDAKAVTEQFKDVPTTEPEKVDVKNLTDQLANAAKKNQEIFNEKARRTECLREASSRCDAAYKIREDAQRTFDQAKRSLEAAELGFKQSQDRKSAVEAEIKALPDIEAAVDVDALRKQVDAAAVKNETHARWEKKKVALETVTALEKKAEIFTACIEEQRNNRLEAVKKAKLPVAGLTLGDDEVLLDGLPLTQASDAEQLRTSVAIAMASNSSLKVIRVRDGSLLDKAGMTLLAEMAAERGYQVWVERVEESGNVGFVMEDGQLK